MEKYNVLGIMSGTSLDGLDLAFCRFEKEDGKWKYIVEAADVFEYTEEWKKRLEGLFHASALELAQTDADFAKFTAICVHDFIKKYQVSPILISSHGHTIFHQPENGFTTQIGSGAIISAHTGLPVVSDLRSVDVALGGQGAPLVPIGDALLFGGYEYCLNLGGIANISYDNRAGNRMAGDICPINLVLNLLAQKKGLKYDEGGAIGKSGQRNDILLHDLKNFEFYQKPFPKSLGREWVESHFLKKLFSYKLPLEDLVATCCHHFAEMIFETVKAGGGNGREKMLVTGGGAFNSFLIDLIREKCQDSVEVVVPDKLTVAYKEAVIFAFLGLLRAMNLNNCLSSVTGAFTDSIGGALYGKSISFGD
ncbi:anhydro-N-acetylmuramic acid kinase [Cytophagaceae bacterium ABcell3]|nr:anhydro-N-acetylmuramic acid kinase [Cytophagaceae bacterium ABcell3]